MNRLHSNAGASIPSCCALLGYSKQAYYKQMKHLERAALAEEVILREIMSIRNELPVLGGRKLFQLITQRLPGSMLPGRDAFFRMLGTNGLLIKKRKSYRPITTISWHRFHKFTNLWKGRTPEGPNQVWAADITYIRLWNGSFVYLSLLTDVYSRKIVGWHLSDRLDMEGPILALEMAIENLPKGHRLIHHSDRGVQYCSKAYVELLQANNIQISMTENGDPRENAVAERVNGILKDEWLNRERMESLEQARSRVETIIGLYNNKRPHLSNNYLTPEQAHKMNGVLKRQWKTYYKKRTEVDNMQEDCVTLQMKPVVDCRGTPAVNHRQD